MAKKKKEEIGQEGGGGGRKERGKGGRWTDNFQNIQRQNISHLIHICYYRSILYLSLSILIIALLVC